MNLTAENRIRPTHYQRTAIIYIRQSTLAQVRENTESTKQQYNLKERAISLGWDPIQVQVIDEDLGLSATSSEKRHGFQKLVAQVSLAQVGAIFGLEVSRLARSCSDWYRLIELCALGDTLIIDQDGIYNPNLYNDRLVLGLKGTLSEAEIHILKLRLLGGKLSAAKEGRLRFPLPVGFVFSEDGRIIFDPNERVQDSIRLVFDTFKQVGSAYKVVQYFTLNQILFPKRDYRGLSAGHLYWGSLVHGRVLNILHNPTYAGAYAYGKSTQQASKKVSFPNSGNTIRLPMEAWEVLIKDHHKGYVTWETYLSNMATLEANRTFIPDTSSPPREGAALLQGIAICGCCGRRFGVWKSNMATTHLVDNPLPASEKRKTPQPTIDLITKLSENHSDHKRVDILNAKGIMSANGQPFSVSKIEYLRYSRRIKSNCKDLPSLKDTGPRADGSYSTRQLAEILDVDPHTIFNWRRKGIITGYQAKPNSPWWFKASQEELDKLKEIVHNRVKSKRNQEGSI